MPFNGPLTYPLINGLRYDFSSITYLANGQPIVGIIALDYDQELPGGRVDGIPAQQIGATRGKLTATASMEMLQLEYQAYITALCVLNGTPQGGHMEVRHDIQVQYQDGVGANQGPLIIDVLRGCKIKKAAQSRKRDEGTPNTVKVDLELFYIVENGQNPIATAFTPG